jgi:hypothetical protein
MSNPTLPNNTPTVNNNYQQSPTLIQIQQKVRRLTRKPSTAQLSDSDLNNYINTFIVYDFPEHLRTFNLRTTFTFYTNPGQDIYNTDEASFAGATNNILYNFQNKYISIHPPFYIAGFNSTFVQSREQFYAIYPIVSNISTTSNTGDGTTTIFSGVINSQQAIVPPGFYQNISLLQNNVLFSAVGTNGEGLALVDVPVVDPVTGFKTVYGNLYDPNSSAYNDPITGALSDPPTIPNIGPLLPGTGVINYLTGVYNISFTTAPATGNVVNSQSVPTTQSRPQAVCYYANQFIVRPVPDQPYAIQFEAFQRPTALLVDGQVPELEEYWQYIAYGAAKKIFEDQMDLDSVQLIMPEFKKQEALVLRRTIVQYTNERTASIYSEQTSFGANSGWGYGPGGPF